VLVDVLSRYRLEHALALDLSGRRVDAGEPGPERAPGPEARRSDQGG
jgi:hypothetical protein